MLARGDGNGPYIPKLSPADEIWVIDLTLRVDVLPGSNHDGFGGCDVYEGRLARICVRNPYGYWESVHVAAEVDGEGSGQMQEQRAGAIGESYRRKGQLPGAVLLHASIPF